MKQKEVDERIVLDDAAVVAIVDKLIKQRKDSITAFEGAGRQDLADKEKAEMAVLQAYLPERMSAEETLAAVKAIVAELGAAGAGRHGQSHGRGQDPPGRQGRHGPGVGSGEGSAGGLIRRRRPEPRQRHRVGLSVDCGVVLLFDSCLPLPDKRWRLFLLDKCMRELSRPIRSG